MDETEIWAEKYRPRTFDEIVGRDEIVRRLRSYVKSGNVPHLLFAGPAGTGKTTCSIVLARELYGDNWRENFLELNASDDRGIRVVRGDQDKKEPSRIKSFARTAPFGGSAFKIIFLDESDALTADAQSALRRTMEIYSRTCRFIFSANYPGKLIEPIQSRCVLFQFTRIREDDMKRYLKGIAEKEGVQILDDALELIVEQSEGDMRKAVNALQASSFIKQKVDIETVYSATLSPEPEEVRALLQYALEGKFRESREMLDSMLFEKGLSSTDIIAMLHKVVIETGLSNDTLLDAIKCIGEAEFRMVQGSSERIQMEALIAELGLIGRRESKGRAAQRTL